MKPQELHFSPTGELQHGELDAYDVISLNDPLMGFAEQSLDRSAAKSGKKHLSESLFVTEKCT